MIPHLVSFGAYLNDCIDTADVSNRSLAKECGCSPSYITHLIAGRREPSVTMLLQLEDKLRTFDALEAMSMLRGDNE